MCIDNPVPFHSDKPIIAYKVMYCNGEDNIRSMLAGNKYKLGSTHYASIPEYQFNISNSSHYDVGFHAYEKLEDAQRIMFGHSSRGYARIVEVELSEITHKGTQRAINDERVWTYVAKQCKFIRIVE